ncbi:hypothetical protein ElyMa_006417300 [Elysia marginata]|uniref:Uncharacterized protein n=1 Tax=Elysia marginata TaxID=1093978 RepID=A0AAV4HTM4_9GAST|nr:hypothetical protein ElyMa_006417300 [Elysia marginata]
MAPAQKANPNHAFTSLKAKLIKGQVASERGHSGSHAMFAAVLVWTGHSGSHAMFTAVLVRTGYSGSHAMVTSVSVRTSNNRGTSTTNIAILYTPTFSFLRFTAIEFLLQLWAMKV